MSGGPIVVEAVETPEPEVLDALASLLPQLSKEAVAPAASELQAIVEGDSTTLLVARDEASTIVGSLTLAVFRVPTGVRAWIEDVVVDEGQRGRGVASALVQEALTRAERAGARTVELTSRPSREGANRLYRQLGFVPRETNVYRRALTAPDDG